MISSDIILYVHIKYIIYYIVRSWRGARSAAIWATTRSRTAG